MVFMLDSFMNFTRSSTVPSINEGLLYSLIRFTIARRFPVKLLTSVVFIQ